MQSIDELRYLVKMGAISEDEAQTIIDTVVDMISENKNELQKSGSVNPSTLLLTSVLGPLTLAGIGVGTHMLSNYLDERQSKKDMAKSFHLMKSVNPDIANIPDQKRLEAFSILQAVSPTIAKNPILAANFVQRHSMNYGGAGFEEAANLARAESALAPREPTLGKQLAGQLINQGIGNLGSVFSSAGSRGIAELTELTPEEEGIADARSLMAQEEALGGKKYLLTKDKMTPEERGQAEATQLLARYRAIEGAGAPAPTLGEALKGRSVEPTGIELGRQEAEKLKERFKAIEGMYPSGLGEAIRGR